MKLLNNSGQALVETVLSLPVVVAGVTMILVGLHSLSFYYWFDHWTYESAVCLIKENSEWDCEKKLKAKLEIFPGSSFVINRFYKTSDHVFVEVLGRGILLPNLVDRKNISMSKTFTEQINTSLSSKDFGDHQ